MSRAWTSASKRGPWGATGRPSFADFGFGIADRIRLPDMRYVLRCGLSKSCRLLPCGVRYLRYTYSASARIHRVLPHIHVTARCVSIWHMVVQKRTYAYFTAPHVPHCWSHG